MSNLNNLAGKPIVGIPTSQVDINGRGHAAHMSSRRNASTIAQYADAIPIMLPCLPEMLSVDEVLAQVDGIMLTGGRANVEPHHYDGPAFPDDEPIDPCRDNTVLPLIRACIDRGIPIFGTCRGIQEINVALGGSLHYRVHVVPGKIDHRMRRDADGNGIDVEDLRHWIDLTPNGLFHEWVGEKRLMVNSLHGQGIDRLADGLKVEAVSDDGIIEGITVEGAKALTVGVQWHAEFNPDTHALSHAIYVAFGQAVREHAARRLGTLSEAI
ncbi:MAG: gamma-glutamyl-gamma-aminobutyrate hydrolase family protein [Gammaproteobacteria bacterium]|nr:gamma-glutamyl-gamma-aminobutyrate hydrolase family protein [Gammaproteobacteria bacterium]